MAIQLLLAGKISRAVRTINIFCVNKNPAAIRQAAGFTFYLCVDSSCPIVSLNGHFEAFSMVLSG